MSLAYSLCVVYIEIDLVPRLSGLAVSLDIGVFCSRNGQDTRVGDLIIDLLLLLIQDRVNV